MSYRAHVVIHGRVQGVGFRFWVQRTATDKMLSGFVRNRMDGTVEAVFSGLRENVEAMVELCQSGPLGARVTDVDRLPDSGAVEGEPKDPSAPFEILRTV